MRQTCKRCRGTKKVESLGYMMVNCPDCGGMGYVEVSEEKTEPAPVSERPQMQPEPDQSLSDALIAEKQKSKRGRPKKIKTEGDK